MPVGDCPMVFPTIMEMLIKQDGNLQKRHYTQTMLHFSNILSWLIDHVFFADHEHVFWQILYILHFENNNTMLHFFCIL